MYKNIIFDVGEVLFSYRWHEAIMMAGATDEEATIIGPKLFNHPLWKDLDLSIRPYWDVVSDLANTQPEYSKIITKFLTDLENMPLDRPRVWEEVKRLKEKGYNLYLCSNYSEYMFKTHTNGKPFMQYIDGAMVSYMDHECKPDAAIYNDLLQKYNLNPSECIFLDDRKENIEGAKKVGIDGIQVLSEEFLLNELAKF